MISELGHVVHNILANASCQSHLTGLDCSFGINFRSLRSPVPNVGGMRIHIIINQSETLYTCTADVSLTWLSTSAVRGR